MRQFEFEIAAASRSVIKDRITHKSMRNKTFVRWEDFESEIDSLFELVKSQRTKREGFYVSTPIFRGLSDASWNLETTLDRFTTTKYSQEDYFRVMTGARCHVESFTGKSWGFSSRFQPVENPTLPPQAYDFMVYLRHHGFPSPLLDWTRSPYIAAFFALKSRQAPKSGNVAIYSYIGDLGFGRSGSSRMVNTIGSYITTDRRHHVQQCEYTFAVEYVGDRCIYCDHESAFEGAMTPQDLLTKYILPYSERTKVLAKMDFMNINSYSLFGDEEGLMDLLAYREIELAE